MIWNSIWFNQFSGFLFDQRFISRSADSSLFVLKQGTDIVVLLLYVDDMIITGNSYVILDNFLQHLKQEFSAKDMVQIHYFLAIQIHPRHDDIFLFQPRYATNLLSKANHTDCKPVSTPMLHKLQVLESSPLFPDPTFYRMLGRSL